MCFSTNTDMVRHYCKELMADGREHSIPEIQSYINWCTGQKGIDGMPLSDQILYSALAHRFERTGRGVYRDPSVGIQQDVTLQTETDKLLFGLKRVDEELSEAFIRNYCDLPFSGGKLQELFAILIQLRSLIRQARELATSETPVMEAKQISAPPPPDQNLESTVGDACQGEPEKWPRMGIRL